MGNNTLSVAEAAKYLGVHRNTVLNRIKSGALPAQPIVQPNGTTSYRISFEALPKDAQNTPNTGQHNWAHNDAQEAPIVSTVQQAQYEALAGPFLIQIVQLGQALGRVEAERDEARKQFEELRRQLDAASKVPTVGAVQDSVATDPATHERRPWWRRILGS